MVKTRPVSTQAGPAASLDRETVVHLGAAAERRLGGRAVGTMAIWLSPLAANLEGGAAVAAELVTRGVVEGSYDPATIYREAVKSSPPRLDELILVAPGESPAAVNKAADRGLLMGEGANYARTLANREFLCPYASLVEVPQDEMIETIGPSLVVTAITKDAGFTQQLLDSDLA